MIILPHRAWGIPRGIRALGIERVTRAWRDRQRAVARPLREPHVADRAERALVVVVAEIGELLADADHRLHHLPPPFRDQAAGDVRAKPRLDVVEPRVFVQLRERASGEIVASYMPTSRTVTPSGDAPDVLNVALDVGVDAARARAHRHRARAPPTAPRACGTRSAGRTGVRTAQSMPPGTG